MAHETVQSHYASAGIVERILAAVTERGGDLGALKPEALYPFDQLHGREIQATREHAERLRPSPSDHVLDIGSGIGGPARFLAATYGCRVTGIDLTSEFVAAARRLTELTGLSGLVAFEEGDASKMPFGDASFEAATSFYVGMNIAGKSAVIGEAYRVLKPGGRILWNQAVSGQAGPPAYPLPWAKQEATSHLLPIADLEEIFRSAGFILRETIDETPVFMELARGMKSHVPSASHRFANELLLGPDFPKMLKNFMEGLVEGRLGSAVIMAQKPLG